MPSFHHIDVAVAAAADGNSGGDVVGGDIVLDDTNELRNRSDGPKGRGRDVESLGESCGSGAEVGVPVNKAGDQRLSMQINFLGTISNILTHTVLIIAHSNDLSIGDSHEVRILVVGVHGDNVTIVVYDVSCGFNSLFDVIIGCLDVISSD